MKRLPRVVPENARVRVIEHTSKPAGDLYWSEGDTHTDASIGRSDTRVIVAEIQ